MPIEHLPPRLRSIAERVRAWALTDAALMVIVGVSCIVRGAAYFVGTVTISTGSPHPSEVWMSLRGWAVVWATVGVVCVVASVRCRSRPAAIALAAAVGLHMLWGLSLLVAGVWLYGAGYFTISILAAYTVWRGSRMELRIREVGRSGGNHR